MEGHPYHVPHHIVGVLKKMKKAIRFDSISLGWEEINQVASYIEYLELTIVKIAKIIEIAEVSDED